MMVGKAISRKLCLEHFIDEFASDSAKANGILLEVVSTSDDDLAQIISCKPLLI